MPTGTDDGDGPWGPVDQDAVHAAGGIVSRPGPVAHAAFGSEWVELLLVHRPRYDDWSFPKGKCDPGETFAETALREVQEETGLRCVLDSPIAEVQYVDHKGRPKVVRYWSMTLAQGEIEAFEPNDEVDMVEWVPTFEARERLTYPHDAELVDWFPIV